MRPTNITIGNVGAAKAVLNWGLAEESAGHGNQPV